jgi:hypothetical protein
MTAEDRIAGLRDTSIPGAEGYSFGPQLRREGPVFYISVVRDADAAIIADVAGVTAAAIIEEALMEVDADTGEADE